MTILDVFLAYGFGINHTCFGSRMTLLMDVVSEGKSLAITHLQDRNELVAKLIMIGRE